jgi:hypothetical protein
MSYKIIDRPARNRRSSAGEGDEALELALLGTLDSGKAIQVPLAEFHTSPAKGRLWADGLKVKHRVLWNGGDAAVAAWVEEKTKEE